MKITKAFLLLSLSSTLFACGGGVDQPKLIGPSSTPSSVAVSSSSVMESSSSTMESSSSEMESSSSVAVSSSSSSAAVIKAARIGDTVNGDTGELRVNVPSTNSPLLSGKLTVSFFKDADLADSNAANKDAYITVWGVGTGPNAGTSNGNAIIDVRLQNTEIEIRDQITSVPKFAYQTGEWQTISISWSSPDATTPATVNVVLNGDTANTKTFTAVAASIGGAHSLAFKLADNTAVVTSDKAFFVDEWHLYSDAAGTSEILYDDFEDFSATTNLNSAQIRQTGITYHVNTQDASVVEKEK